MNSLSPLGLLTCFIISIALTGASPKEVNTESLALPGAYITNNSADTIYFKPESRIANPGLDPNAAYALSPGTAYYLPFDAVVTPATTGGRIYQVPNGSRVVINRQGIPEPANIIAQTSLLISKYGLVKPPCANFAKLANPKGVLYHLPDINVE